jgi:predicted dehydrogenase
MTENRDSSETLGNAPERPARPSSLSRRQFLVRSAGLAGASFGLGVKAPAGVEAGQPGAEIRLGLIGAGERGTQLLTAALACPGFRVLAVADPLPAARLRAFDLAGGRGGSAGATAGGTLLAQSAERLFEFAARGKLDAVLIASPPYLHRAQAVEALRAGLHVYLEKPLGLSVADCEEVRREAVQAEARGQVFQIGFQRRYSPRYLAGLEAIRDGRAGRVLTIETQWHSLGDPNRAKGWYFQRDKSGDLLLEQGCHQLDICNWVLGGPPAKAAGFGGLHQFRERPPGRTVRDHCLVSFEFPGGAKVQHSHLSYALPDRRFSGIHERVFGESLGIDFAHGLAFDRAGKSFPLLGGDAPSAPAASRKDTELALDGFLRHIRGGERPLADIEAAYLATMASLLGLRALDTGEVARWEALIG